MEYLGPKAQSRGHIKLTITQGELRDDCIDLARDDAIVFWTQNVALNSVRGGQIPDAL